MHAPILTITAGLMPGEFVIHSPKSLWKSPVLVPPARAPAHFRIQPMRDAGGTAPLHYGLVRAQQQPWPGNEQVETLLIFAEEADANAALDRLIAQLLTTSTPEVARLEPEPMSATGARVSQEVKAPQKRSLSLGASVFFLVDACIIALGVGIWSSNQRTTEVVPVEQTATSRGVSTDQEGGGPGDIRQGGQSPDAGQLGREAAAAATRLRQANEVPVPTVVPAAKATITDEALLDIEEQSRRVRSLAQPVMSAAGVASQPAGDAFLRAAFGPPTETDGAERVAAARAMEEPVEAEQPRAPATMGDLFLQRARGEPGDEDGEP